jgi:TRAP-type C4-dicarboxylate transport system permease small subunit
LQATRVTPATANMAPARGPTGTVSRISWRRRCWPTPCMAAAASRYFNLHLPDTGEIAIYAMAPLTFVGAAMCTCTGTHIAVDIIQQVKSPWVRRTGRMATALAMVVFGAVYFHTALAFFQSALSSGERGLDLGTPVAIPTFFFPLGMALVVLHAVAELIRAATNEPSLGEEHL